MRLISSAAITQLTKQIELDDHAHGRAMHLKERVVPAMETVRLASDRLERAVPHDLWPIPTYRDILFVK
jgi:glutamine synthetase